MRPKTNAQYKYMKARREKKRLEAHIDSMPNYRADPLEWLKLGWQPKKVTVNGNILRDADYYDRHEINDYMEV